MTDEIAQHNGSYIEISWNDGRGWTIEKNRNVSDFFGDRTDDFVQVFSAFNIALIEMSFVGVVHLIQAFNKAVTFFLIGVHTNNCAFSINDLKCKLMTESWIGANYLRRQNAVWRLMRQELILTITTSLWKAFAGNENRWYVKIDMKALNIDRLNSKMITGNAFINSNPVYMNIWVATRKFCNSNPFNWKKMFHEKHQKALNWFYLQHTARSFWETVKFKTT